MLNRYYFFFKLWFIENLWNIRTSKFLFLFFSNKGRIQPTFSQDMKTTSIVHSSHVLFILTLETFSLRFFLARMLITIIFSLTQLTCVYILIWQQKDKISCMMISRLIYVRYSFMYVSVLFRLICLSWETVNY